MFSQAVDLKLDKFSTQFFGFKAEWAKPPKTSLLFGEPKFFERKWIFLERTAFVSTSY
jgi:hypothetical protein